MKKQYKWNKRKCFINLSKLFSIMAIITICFIMLASTHIYKINAKVIDTNNNITTFYDCVGDTWEWYNEQGEHFTIGEEVKLKIYTPIPEKSTKAYDEIRAIMK